MEDAGAAGRQAWLHIVQLFTSDENRRVFVDTAAGLGLTPAGLHALLSLLPDGRPMRALAEEWHCDPSQVTAIVDQLEQRDLAERRIHPTDRRVRTVKLTAEGEAARARAMERLSVPPPGIDALSAAEQGTLRDLLAKVTAHLPALR
jgi:DNA-binding MarR family transcriptional regulator